ncbi:discoidin domain-containing protein [Nocardia sp. CA2R105]|uniref:discoidin domain-containing protein n=1 Tax=Nocardia coffeae TaxID=2873381 RepID=UPI001CA65174|nr:discoidin domain-containing protein [Nocardia coffeae]MBY8862765.1 discoidin domain-containing protein [Nocardia coffeae]
MSDSDPGDIFIRHRGAVLEALLSDPALGHSTGPAAGASSPASPAVGVPPATAGESAAGPVGGGVEPDVTAPSPRRSGGAPRASDRIMALLNGESPGSSPDLEYASDLGRMAANRSSAPPEAAERPTTPTATESSRTPSTSASASQGSSAAGLGRDLIVQLRKPKVALTVAAVLAVLLVILLITTGGNDKKQSQLAVITPVAAAPPTSSAKPTATEAASAPIPVKTAKAHCPSGSTDAMDAFGGETGKAWSCVRAYKVDGQVLTIDLGKTYEVDSIGIDPGWDGVGADGADQWTKYRTVSRVSYQFNDSNLTTYTQQTLDERSLVVTKLSPPVRASKVTLTILESKGDPSTNTTAISSIVITGN